ncbi:MAG: T9SS type A sorting domain-containing protein [Weeksellaceae bacterium]|nr:T9SS type A sorting domain-containing protein [Weeksellaceae bacterium]
MKKILLSAFFLSATFVSTVQAQVLEAYNYDALTLGNVGGTVDGLTAGQGGIYSYYGAVADYNIASIDAAHGKSLQIKNGSTAATASSRYTWMDGMALSDAWAARTAGNDFLYGKIEIYTGTATGTNRSGSYLASATSGIVGATYNSGTKQINAMMYLSGAASGFYNITGVSTATFPANTWVTLQYAYDYNTGDTYIKIGNGTPLLLSVTGYTTLGGSDPVEHDVFTSYATGNNASTTAGFDNYVIEAKVADQFLGAVEVKGQIGSEIATVYPNPAVDVLNISYSKKVKSVEVYDFSGKKIKANLTENKVDVSNLAKGTYLININTGVEVQTQKFIKK